MVDTLAGLDGDLVAVSMGLNAEVFASVVTFGDARDANGEPLHLSDDAMRFTMGGTIPLDVPNVNSPRSFYEW